MPVANQFNILDPHLDFNLALVNNLMNVISSLQAIWRKVTMLNELQMVRAVN